MSLSIEPQKGIRLKLANYSIIKTWQGGGGKFWEHDFQLTIRQGALQEFLPKATEQGDEVFYQHFVDSNEAASVSVQVSSLNQVPTIQIERLRSALAELKSKAEDPHCDYNKKRMIEAFRLPDPQKDPELYRLYGSGSKRRLIVLWGVEKEVGSALAPLQALGQVPQKADGFDKKWLWLFLILILLFLALFLIKSCQTKTSNGVLYPGTSVASPSPAGTSSSPAGTSPSPAGTSSSPAGTSPSPAGTSPSPAGTSPSPAGTSPSPAGTPPSPAGTSPSPAGTSPSPAGTSPSPAGTSPSPAGTSPSPAGTPPSPAGTSPSPAGTSPSPAGTSSSPAGTSSSPAGTSPSPAGTPPSPAGTPPSPAGTSPSPAGTPPSPAGTPPSPAGTSPSPAGTSPSPAGTSPSPAGTSPSLAGTNNPTLEIINTRSSTSIKDGLIEVLLNVVARDTTGSLTDVPIILEWKVDGVVQNGKTGTPIEAAALVAHLSKGTHSVTVTGASQGNQTIQAKAEVVVGLKVLEESSVKVRPIKP